MAREVLTKIWCDQCLKSDVMEEGHEHTISISGPLVGTNFKPRMPALCEVHEKEFLLGLVELLRDCPPAPADAAVPTAAPRKGSGRVAVPGGITCKVCGSVAKNVSSLGGHLRTQHDMKLSQYRELHGVEVQGSSDPGGTLFDESAPATPTPPSGEEKVMVQCDICSEELRANSNRVTQVIGVHKSKKHGIKGTGKR